MALNLGTGKGTSIGEILRLVEEASERKVPHDFAPPRAGDPPVLYAEAHKAKEVLGWVARHDIRQTIHDAVHWEEQLPAYLNSAAD